MSDSAGRPPARMRRLAWMAISTPSWRRRIAKAIAGKAKSLGFGLGVVAALGASAWMAYQGLAYALPWVGGHGYRVFCSAFSCEPDAWRAADASGPRVQVWRDAIRAVAASDPESAGGGGHLGRAWRRSKPSGALVARKAAADEFERSSRAWLAAREAERGGYEAARDARMAASWMREMAVHGDPARAARSVVGSTAFAPRAPDPAEAAVREALASLAAAPEIRMDRAELASLFSPWARAGWGRPQSRAAFDDGVRDDAGVALGFAGVGALIVAALLAAALNGFARDARRALEGGRSELERDWERHELSKASERRGRSKPASRL